MVKIFASELSKCRKIKLLYGILLSISLFVVLLVFPVMWILAAPVEKTEKDFVFEYVVKRLNYTPDTVYKAVFTDLQYKFPLYEETVKEEIEIAKKLRLYQQFLPQKIKKREKYFEVRGKVVQISCKDGCKVLLDKEGIVKVGMIKKKREKYFVVEEKNW